jgi:hypothetical protein
MIGWGPGTYARDANGTRARERVTPPAVVRQPDLEIEASPLVGTPWIAARDSMPNNGPSVLK